MHVHYSATKCLILLVLLQACSLDAVADIYLDTNAVEEISLSNIGGEDHYEILIADDHSDEPPPIKAPVTTLTDHMPFADAVQTASRENMLDPALIHAVIAAESHHNPNAISPRGAQGLMQLMPATAQRLGLRDPYDPEQNIRAGSQYLRELKEMFKGDISLTLAAYNAGPGAVMRYGTRIPPFEETRRYVPKVMQLYRKLSSQN